MESESITFVEEREDDKSVMCSYKCKQQQLSVPGEGRRRRNLRSGKDWKELPVSHTKEVPQPTLHNNGIRNAFKRCIAVVCVCLLPPERKKERKKNNKDEKLF